MSTTLRVFVGEHWPERPVTRWVLVDAAGTLLQHGESDALRWPAADFCEAVISAPEVSCLRAVIPQRVSRRDLPQVVAGVLEDQLLDDADRCHLTICARQRDIVDVLVISRVRLRNVLAQFAALNRPLSAVHSELLALAATGQTEWTIALAKDAAMLSRQHEVPLVLDGVVDGTPPMLVEALARDAGAGGDIRVTIRPEAGTKVDLASWKEALHTENVRVGPEYHWYASTAREVDLLHGEFASRQRRNGVWQLVRPAVVVAASTLLAYLVVGLFQVGLTVYRINQAEGRVTELFRAAFPGVPAVAPVAQARRHLDQLRASHGLSRRDDVLSLLAVVSEVLGTDGENSVREVGYGDRRLTVVMEPAMAGRLDGFQRQLQKRGYQVTTKSTPQGHPSLLIQLDMTR